MTPPRACKKDLNHDTVTAALQRCGLFVLDAHEWAQYTPGVADLLVFWGQRAAWVEVKMPGESLNGRERKFRLLCAANGVTYVMIDNEEDALKWAREWRGND